MSRLQESDRCTCKVGSVLDTYDIPEYDVRIVDQWTRSADHVSLRELADSFNKRILEAAFRDAGRQTVTGEVENIYRLLTADDVTSGMRTQTRDQLQQDSIPIDTVESDFVSHQTIYRHLRSCHDVERTTMESGSETDRIEKGAQTIQSLRGKTRAVTENTIGRLSRSADLTLSDFDVFVDITVTCNDCGRQVSIDDLLESGGCQCALDE